MPSPGPDGHVPEGAPRSPLSTGDLDPVLAALDELAAAADDITDIAALIREYLPRIRHGRAASLSYREILALAPRPLIGALLTEAVQRFEAAGSRYRRAHGRALQGEGMTLQEIAGLWGLTRQRISELLQADDHPGRRHPTAPAPLTAESGSAG